MRQYWRSIDLFFYFLLTSHTCLPFEALGSGSAPRLDKRQRNSRTPARPEASDNPAPVLSCRVDRTCQSVASFEKRASGHQVSAAKLVVGYDAHAMLQ